MAQALAPVLMLTSSPSASVFSWMTTVSAPRGIGAPVKMRTASPVPTVPVKGMTGRGYADDFERDRGWLRHRPKRTA